MLRSSALPVWTAAVVLLGAVPAVAGDRIGDIEFFGYKGLDLAVIRRAMPVRTGDEYSGRTQDEVRRAVRASTGKEPTDLAAICCDEKGDRLLFIGLPGASSKSFVRSSEPEGDERLPPAVMDLSGRLDLALEAAVRKGDQAAEEDDSRGYALVKDQTARALQLDLRRWAIQHEGLLRRVLEFSSSAGHRRVASVALGYARQSRAQILALVRAARDPDDEVRNNATRALGVLVRSNAALAARIQPDTFINMLNSGTWTDRNKAAWLLLDLTAGRNSDLLGKIRSIALDSLIEMAMWRRPGHAYPARIVLGRLAGLPEDRARELAWKGPADALVEAVRR
jgi:hypothetical protein